MAGHTSVPLVAAVSNAGGLGTLGMAVTPAEQIPKDIGAIRETTKCPFGVNFLLFRAREPAIDAALNARPPVFSAAWAGVDQDLRALCGRVHEVGSLVSRACRSGRGPIQFAPGRRFRFSEAR